MTIIHLGPPSKITSHKTPTYTWKVLFGTPLSKHHSNHHSFKTPLQNHKPYNTNIHLESLIWDPPLKTTFQPSVIWDPPPKSQAIQHQHILGKSYLGPPSQNILPTTSHLGPPSKITSHTTPTYTWKVLFGTPLSKHPSNHHSFGTPLQNHKPYNTNTHLESLIWDPPLKRSFRPSFIWDPPPKSQAIQHQHPLGKSYLGPPSQNNIPTTSHLGSPSKITSHTTPTYTWKVLFGTPLSKHPSNHHSFGTPLQNHKPYNTNTHLESLIWDPPLKTSFQPSFIWDPPPKSQAIQHQHPLGKSYLGPPSQNILPTIIHLGPPSKITSLFGTPVSNHYSSVGLGSTWTNHHECGNGTKHSLDI